MELKTAFVSLFCMFLCYFIPIHGQNHEIIHFDAANSSIFPRNAIQGFKNFHTKKGQYLNVTPIKVLQVKTEKLCSLRCVAELQCVSFNFAVFPSSSGQYRCELLAANMFRNPSNLISNNNFHHFILQTKCLSATTCKKDEICIPNYNNETAYTCKYCKWPLGMESGAIADSSITASSEYDHRYIAKSARLNRKVMPSGWIPARTSNVPEDWIQVDLRTITYVTGVATQGAHNYNQEWTKSYSIQYSVANKMFIDYKDGKIFKGNIDKYTKHQNNLVPPIAARYIKLVPKTWSGSLAAIRMELYGCTY